MKFTDEDLKDLIKTMSEAEQVTDLLEVDIPRLRTLLSRLQAAEECLKDYFEVESIHPFLVQEWKKSAGK